MASQTVLLFDLKNRIVDTIRDLKMLDINHKRNKLKIESFHALLSDVGTEVETCKRFLATFQNISDPKAVLGKDYETACLEGVKKLKSTLATIESTDSGAMAQAFPNVLNELFLHFEKQLEELKEKVDKLASVISHLHQVTIDANDPYPNEPDSFIKSVNTVPVNPPHIVLDFEEKSESPESKLKKAIFDNSIGTVTAIANGMGGIGKTCALRGVGLLEEASRRFPDGIFYMSLGEESGQKELIQNIAEFVRRSGGYKKSKDVGVAKDVPRCVNIAAEWFRGRVCLMLIDDV